MFGIKSPLGTFKSAAHEANRRPLTPEDRDVLGEAFLRLPDRDIGSTETQGHALDYLLEEGFAAIYNAIADRSPYTSVSRSSFETAVKHAAKRGLGDEEQAMLANAYHRIYERDGDQEEHEKALNTVLANGLTHLYELLK